MQNYSSYVAAALARYQSPVVYADQEEPGKAQLTRAAAWDIFQVNPNIGLKAKTSGNQVAGLTVDTLLDRTTGEVVDIATSRPDPPGCVTILAGWYPYAPNPAEVVNWVAPTQELADMAGPMVPISDPPPDPAPEPDDDQQEIMYRFDAVDVALSALSQQLATSTGDILARSDTNTEKIQTQIHDLVEDVEATLI